MRELICEICELAKSGKFYSHKIKKKSMKTCEILLFPQIQEQVVICENLSFWQIRENLIRKMLCELKIWTVFENFNQKILRTSEY